MKDLNVVFYIVYSVLARLNVIYYQASLDNYISFKLVRAFFKIRKTPR